MTNEITRRDPLEMTTPVWGFGRLWDDFFAPLRTQNGGRSLAPVMDVSESEHGYTISVELPGLKKQDVKITIEDGVLTLSGEKQIESERKGKSFHRMERSYGAFTRSVTLPNGVDTSKADATFVDGVLTIELPKTEAAKPQLLKIK